MAILLNAQEGDNLKKTLSPHLVYGPALIEHSLLSAGITANARIGKEFTVAQGENCMGIYSVNSDIYFVE